jgi:hypothetical protein
MWQILRKFGSKNGPSEKYAENGFCTQDAARLKNTQPAYKYYADDHPTFERFES